MTGYAFTGSFCTLSQSVEELKRLVANGIEIQPIMSERVYSTDTRFYMAHELRNIVTSVTGREIIHTVEGAEPLGAIYPLDNLIISPCTGNTAAKIALGITDSAVTMAAKAHLRCDRPLLIALASNDALSQNLKNISTLLSRKSVFLLPMKQDDPKGKPHSLVADFSLLSLAFSSMVTAKEQLRPIFR